MTVRARSTAPPSPCCCMHAGQREPLAHAGRERICTGSSPRYPRSPTSSSRDRSGPRRESAPGSARAPPGLERGERFVQVRPVPERGDFRPERLSRAPCTSMPGSRTVPRSARIAVCQDPAAGDLPEPLRPVTHHQAPSGTRSSKTSVSAQRAHSAAAHRRPQRLRIIRACYYSWPARMQDPRDGTPAATGAEYTTLATLDGTWRTG